MLSIRPKLRFVYRLVETVGHLTCRQIIYQFWYRLRRRKKPTIPVLQSRPLLQTHKWLEKRVSWQPENSFIFLNESRECVKEINWTDQGAEKLWLYNLHYFDFLLSNDSEDYLEHCDSAIEDWISRCTDLESDAWEPYPTSLRIVNWIKYQTAHQRLNEAALDSLARQVNWLFGGLEYHIMANHLFANAKALVFAGIYFDGPEASEWLQKGQFLVNAQLKEQVLADGGHFERSPMYHSIVLEDVLDLINLATATEHVVRESSLQIWNDTACRMLNWQSKLLHPDGQIAFYNDSAFGIAPELSQLQNYANRLSLLPSDAADSHVQSPQMGNSELLSASGFARLCRGKFHATANLGSIGPDYQPGHAHAETLSCEVSIGRNRLFVNSGTSTYKKGPERDWQRSTAAHNTIEVGGENSSDVWGGFRVARRAHATRVQLNIGEQSDCLQGSHNGYRRFDGAPKHIRKWKLSINELIITDCVTATKSAFVCRWLLHPSVEVLNEYQMRMPDSTIINWCVDGGEVTMVQAYWYPEFGVKQSTQRICITVQADQDIPKARSVRTRLWLSES